MKPGHSYYIIYFFSEIYANRESAKLTGVLDAFSLLQFETVAQLVQSSSLGGIV